MSRYPMNEKIYFTRIVQHEVRVLSEKDWKGYEKNRPGDNWELVEYVGVKEEDGKPHQAWVPNYSLGYKKFNDHSRLHIEEV